MKVNLHAIGHWQPADVVSRWSDSSQTLPAELQDEIDRAWNTAIAAGRWKLFDGPMCRLDRFSAAERLELELSRTSYKVFWGTNLHGKNVKERFGGEALANPLGLSCALQSADGFLLLGRRSATVAYYPSRVHPFAGALEPGDCVDVFSEIRRELAEELSLGGGDVAEIWCAGIVEDISISQPELVFAARTGLRRDELMAQLDKDEHEAIYAIQPEPSSVELALRDGAMTPVALGTILLWGRAHFGAGWFDAARQAVNLG